MDLCRCGGISGLVCDSEGRRCFRDQRVERAGYSVGSSGGVPGVFHAGGLRDGRSRLHPRQERLQHLHEELPGLLHGEHGIESYAGFQIFITE